MNITKINVYIPLMENIFHQRNVFFLFGRAFKSLLIFNDIENERMVDDEMKVNSTASVWEINQNGLPTKILALQNIVFIEGNKVHTFLFQYNNGMKYMLLN